MGQQTVALLAFNRGRVSPNALARVDVERMAMSAETMTNWRPRVLGPMMLRPGYGYIGATRSNLATRGLPFVKSTDDTALIELTASTMRVWVDDALITRPSVSSAVANGTFDTNLTSWTDNDEGSAASAWVTGGYMGLTGTGTSAAIRDQQVTVGAADLNVEHALSVIIERGPVVMSIGSTSGGGEYLDEAVLETGAHSLAFTPTGDFYIRFMSRLKRQVLVNSCTVEAAGVMTVATPWPEAALGNIRIDQSGDVVFVACEGYQQRRIERRGVRSWGVPRYAPEDGPFLTENVGPITITPSALSGNITLTASARLFKSTHAPSSTGTGALFAISSEGQTVTASLTAQNTFTSTIRVTGAGTDRAFTIVRSGTWAAGGTTVTLQRSLTSDTGPWTDVASYTTNATISFNDALDNQVAWYQIGIKTGDYVAGTADLQLVYSLGSIDGVARITAYTSPTVVSAEVITDLGGTAATDVWAEGQWSDYRGWPTSVALHQGRLWWAGNDTVNGSISDGFNSFDASFEGDAGPISKTIGSGPVDVINWILPGQRLLLGTEGAELSCSSTSFDEPLTPSNFNIKPASTQGSGKVGAVKIDNNGVFVQRGGTRLFELQFDVGRLDYDARDLSLLIPEIGQPQIVRMAVQRQPDTRVHGIRSDGTVALLVFDKAEEIVCWCDDETTGASGLVEDVVVLPGAEGSDEDRVYYVVKRTINGSTVRYWEKHAKESECVGSTQNKQADSFVAGTQSASTTITGLSHLEGATVVVWGNGVDLGTKVVTGGQITGLSASVTSYVVGLSYTAQWKSSKLAYAAQRGTALGQKKNIPQIGVVVANTHYQGLQYGRDFSHLEYMPKARRGAAVAENTIYSAYDEESVSFNGIWDTDSRVCLQAAAPRPCMVMALVVPIDTRERA